jgi:hypothetical protein
MIFLKLTKNIEKLNDWRILFFVLPCQIDPPFAKVGTQIASAPTAQPLCAGLRA